jgi:hypothetical protein
VQNALQISTAHKQMPKVMNMQNALQMPKAQNAENALQTPRCAANGKGA